MNIPEKVQFLISSAEFWSAIAGAVVGGGLTFLGSLFERWQQLKTDSTRKLNSDRAQVRIIFVKIMGCYTDLNELDGHFKDASDRLSDRLSEIWQTAQPIVNLPEPLDLRVEQLALLLELRQFDEFHRILDLVRLHASIIGSMAVFNQLSLELKNELLQVSEVFPVDGQTFGGSLRPADAQRLRPKMVQLNTLIGSIMLQVSEGAAKARIALSRLQHVANTHLEDRINYTLDARRDG